MEQKLQHRPRRINRLFSDTPLFTKLILIYAVVMLVPTLTIALTASRSVQRSVTREVEQSHRQLVRQVASGVETKIETARSVAESLAFSHRIRSFLTQRFTMNPYTLDVYMNQVAALVNNALSFHTGTLHKATIYMTNETVPEHWRMFLWTSRVSGLQWYQSFIASGHADAHVYPNTADHIALGQDPDRRSVLTWIARIDTVDGRYLGLVALDILENEVFAALHEAAGPDRWFSVIDEAGDLVYRPAGQANGIGARGALTVVEPVGDFGLFVRADFPMTGLAQQTTRAGWSMMLSAFVGFALSVALAFFVLRALFGTVNTMIRSMHTVAEGDLLARVPVRGNDEIGQLARDFNHLIERINALVNRVVVEEREKHEAQLAALQYQINPHFIYNTIDLFRMKLELDGIYDTADAITSFGKMVRYTMAGDAMYASIESELEHVRHFVALQRIRHAERVTLETTCDAEAESRRVMKLVLQPIVENSVIHALRCDGSPLTVSIDVSISDGRVTIVIADDGVGIPSGRLEEIRWLLRRHEVTFSTSQGPRVGIGLANIAGRLQLFYGDAAAFDIQSEEGHGTRVTVTFPDQADL